MTLEINQETDQEILQYLAENPGHQFSKTIAHGIGTEPETVAKRLFDLERRDKVVKFRTNGSRKNTYQLTEANIDPVAMTEEKQEYPTAAESTLNTELNALQQQLNYTWKIEDKEKKINVLDRLSDLLDDSISEVLVSIRHDLSHG